MKLPSVFEYMAKLASNPQVAAEFAAATPGRSRLEAVQACHRLAVATLSEIEINKRKLALARAKIAALEAARKSAPVATRAAARPTKAESAAAKFSRLQKTDPRAAAAFYQENRLAILNPTPTH